MKYTNFDQLEKAYSKYSDEDNYPEAIKILEEGLSHLSKKEIEDNYFTINTEKCWLYCNDGRFDEVIEIFSKLIDDGYICPIDWNFDELISHERFEELVAKNDQVKIDVQKDTKFNYVLHVPDNYTEDKKYPVFFSFHGDGDNLKNHEKYWKPQWLTDQGYIVVCPQSSKVHSHEGYIWIDSGFYAESNETRKYPYTYSSMHKEIKSCYDSLKRDYSIDEECIILGGFSGGSVAAIDIAVSGVIPAKGVIPLCSLKPRNFTEENLVSLHSKDIKFVFMDGENDLPSEEVDEMIAALNEHDIPNEYIINLGIGHWYPDDLQSKLDSAFSFILE